MKRQIYFSITFLFVFLMLLSNFAWSADIYLEGTLVSDIYTTDGNIYLQNYATVNDDIEVYVLPDVGATIIGPGTRIKTGGLFAAFTPDGDSLPDIWEIETFGKLGEVPDGDYDGDELTNLEEYQLGTDPTYYDPDTDDDGLPDRWELDNFGNLNQNGEGDYDDDDCSNYLEYIGGTDPDDPNSYPEKAVSYKYDELGRIIEIKRNK